VSPPSPPLLGMYLTNGAFPAPGPAAWASGPTTNLTATYVGWGFDVPTYITAFLSQCSSNGLVPFVELEPWTPTPVLFSDITSGTWDAWLASVGSAIAASGKACILTFAHEMNVSGQYPWAQGDTGSGPGGGALTPAEWIQGWNYVRDKVNSTANGFALWMWACSAYTGGTTVSPAPWWPGSGNVDMVGIDGYPNTQYGASLGTFAGQLGPTVSIIRGLGWTDWIYISETNLAEMVSSGGESITSFVADMYANKVSGILEFEDASWNLPQMSSAQWTEYNNAVTTYYGTPGGGGGGGTTPSSGFAAVGQAFSAAASTFSVTPVAAGDFILCEVISETAADYATALSSSNVTWSVLVAHATLGSSAATVFIGEVTSTATATVTVTLSGGTPVLRVTGQEFSASGGYPGVQLDTSGTVNAGTAFPSLTPGHGAGELYWGFLLASAPASAGTTSGYTYALDGSGDLMAYNADCASGAQAPNAGGPGTLTGIAVLLYQGAAALTATAALAVTPSLAAAARATGPHTGTAALTVAPVMSEGIHPLVTGTWSGSYAAASGYAFPSPSAAPVQVQVASTAGDWLFALVAWRPTVPGADVSVSVADDAHNWWEPAGLPPGSIILDTAGAPVLDTSGTAILDTTGAHADSPAAGTVRAALWAAPAARAASSAAGVTTVQVAPTGPVTALAVLIAGVSNLKPWFTVAVAGTAYANSATGLAVSAAAPPAQALLFSLFASDNSRRLLAGPSGWTALPPVSATNGTDGTSDITLTAGWQSTTLASSASLAASGTLDLAGVIAGVLVSAPQPAQPSPGWPIMITEAAVGSGVQTPPSQLTWTDMSSRVLQVSMTQGRQYSLSQLSAGQGAMVLDNPDGALIPPGTGAFAGIDSGTPVRRRVIIPASPTPHYVAVNGFFRRWPWNMDAGLYRGKTQAEITDAWAYATLKLNSMAIEECLIDVPHSLWPCTDPAGSTGASNLATGNSLPLTQTVSKYGAGGATAVFGADSGALKGASSALVTSSGQGGGSSGRWQQALAGASLGTSGYGYCLRCDDTSFPAISGGVTVECWASAAVNYTAQPANIAFNAATTGVFSLTASVAAGSAVVLSVASGFTFPAGVTAGTTYYVLGNSSSNSVQLSATPGGAPVTVTVAGAGYIQVITPWDPVIFSARDGKGTVFGLSIRGADGALLLLSRQGAATAAVATAVDTSHDYRTGGGHFSLAVSQAAWRVLVNAGGQLAASGTFASPLPALFRTACFGGVQDVTAQGYALAGTIAFPAVIPGVSTQQRTVSRFWATGFGMELERAPDRVERILEYAGLTGRRWIGQQDGDYSLDTCVSGQDIGGQPAASCAGNIADSTLPAMLYVAPTGDITYLSREFTWNQPTRWTLGTDAAAGEIPFTPGSVATDYDPSRVVEDVQLTQLDDQSVTLPSGVMASTTMAAVARATEAQYGGSAYQKTGYLGQDWATPYAGGSGLVDLSNWLANVYARPANRVQKVTVEAAANSANASSWLAWQFWAGASPGDMVQVNIRVPTVSTSPLIAVKARITQVQRQSQYSAGGASATITCALDFAPEQAALTCDDPVLGLLDGSNVLPWLTCPGTGWPPWHGRLSQVPQYPGLLRAASRRRPAAPGAEERRGIAAVSARGQFREALRPARLQEHADDRFRREVNRGQRAAVVLRRFRLGLPAASFAHPPMVGARCRRRRSRCPPRAPGPPLTWSPCRGCALTCPTRRRCCCRGRTSSPSPPPARPSRPRTRSR
jgi:hypothetical protein